MNLAYICFTCKRDEQLLPAHFANIKKTSPEAPVYYCIDALESDIRTPEGSLKLFSNKPRGGNLTGLDWHIEQLKKMIQVADAAAPGQADFVIVKIDSDTAILSDKWIKPGYDMLGFAPADNYYCKGSCYAITRACAERVLDYISSPNYKDFSGRIEDGVITMAAAISGFPNCVRIYNPIDGESGEVANSIIFYHNFFGNPGVIRRISATIDCANSRFLELYPDEQARREAARRALECVYSARF